MIAYTFPLLDIFWSMFLFFGLVVWIWVLMRIFGDLLRSEDIGGWSKAGWFLAVLLFPLFGALIYLIARGRSMHERAVRDAEQQERAFRRYIHEAATSDGSSTADELSKLAALVEKGAISQQEFEEQKAKLLGRAPAKTAEGSQSAAA